MLQEERCNCGQLLCKIAPNEYIEIKCRRCKRLYIVSVKKLEKMAEEGYNSHNNFNSRAYHHHHNYHNHYNPVEQRQPLTKPIVKYVALESSDRFHYPDCRWALRIRKDCLITFESRDEALDSGYMPCKVCNP